MRLYFEEKNCYITGIANYWYLYHTLVTCVGTNCTFSLLKYAFIISLTYKYTMAEVHPKVNCHFLHRKLAFTSFKAKTGRPGRGVGPVFICARTPWTWNPEVSSGSFVCDDQMMAQGISCYLLALAAALACLGPGTIAQEGEYIHSVLYLVFIVTCT